MFKKGSIFFYWLLSVIYFTPVDSIEFLQKYLTPVNSDSQSSGLKNVDRIYVINLDERSQRWEKIKSLFEAHSLLPVRVPAVNGWKLSRNEAKKLTTKESYQASLTLGMIGCALSHIKTWNDAVKGDYNVIWVLEDDVVFLSSPHKLSKFIERLTLIDPNWDVFYTDPNTRDWDGFFEEGNSLINPPPFVDLTNIDHYHTREVIDETIIRLGSRHGCYSMLISKAGIKKLFEFHVKHLIWGSIDHTLHYTPGLKQYALQQPIVTHTIAETRHSDTETALEAF